MTLAIDLTDQVALVTGGGAGIGRGIALSLAECGADIVLAEIDPDRGEEAAGAVRAAGRSAVFVPTDVMQTDAVNHAVTTAQESFGRLDILVNNAGGVAGRRFLEQSERSWRRHIDINLVSMLAATSAAARVMIAGGEGGSIINVASIEAHRAAPLFAVYAACKAGMLSFTRTMALELAEHRIRVNAIAPDMTRTPGLSGLRRRGRSRGAASHRPWPHGRRARVHPSRSGGGDRRLRSGSRVSGILPRELRHGRMRPGRRRNVGVQRVVANPRRRVEPVHPVMPKRSKPKALIALPLASL